MQLVAIPSPSGHERALGEQIRDWLSDAGIAVALRRRGRGQRLRCRQSDRRGARRGRTRRRSCSSPTWTRSSPAPSRSRRCSATTACCAPRATRSSAPTTSRRWPRSCSPAARRRGCRSSAARGSWPRSPAGRRPGRMGASLLDLGGAGDRLRVLGRWLAADRHRHHPRARADDVHRLGPRPGRARRRQSRGRDQRDRGGGRDRRRAAAGPSAGRGQRQRRRDRRGRRDRPARSDDVLAALAATPTNSVPDVTHIKGEIRGYSVDEIERDGAGDRGHRRPRVRGSRGRL